MRIDAGSLVIGALFILAVLFCFVNIPKENIELIKQIIIAFIAFVTGTATGIYFQRRKDDEKANPAVPSA